MGGYREPTPPVDPTSLSLCEKHGLRFDPAVQSGCTLCRREAKAGEASSARTVGVVFALLGLAGVASAYGYKAWAKSRAAPVGSACEARFGCVEGADCMARGIIPGRYGNCYRRCSSDAMCGAGQTCSDGHCFEAASIGGVCGGDVVCREGACVTLAGESTCLQSCSSLSVGTSASERCPAGTTCTRVASSFAPFDPMMAREYCVDDR